MNETKRVIICKDEDSNRYEIWERLSEGSILDYQFLDFFEDMNVCIKYCDENNFKIERNY